MTSGRSKRLGCEAQALARRECGVVARALSLGRHPNAAIHRGRKTIRRLRALLALLEPRFDGLATADRKLQRLGDSLSRLRDAHVAVDVAQSIAARGASTAWQPMIERLVLRREDLIVKALAQDPSFERRRAVMDLACQVQILEQARDQDLRAVHPVNSMQAFWSGLPGWLQCNSTLFAWHQSATDCAVYFRANVATDRLRQGPLGCHDDGAGRHRGDSYGASSPHAIFSLRLGERGLATLWRQRIQNCAGN